MKNISQIKAIRSGNFGGWKIPLSLNPARAYKALDRAQYRPVMQKVMENGERYALLGVRLYVAPWERAILESLFKEADKIVCRALGC